MGCYQGGFSDVPILLEKDATNSSLHPRREVKESPTKALGEITRRRTRNRNARHCHSPGWCTLFKGGQQAERCCRLEKEGKQQRESSSCSQDGGMELASTPASLRDPGEGPLRIHETERAKGFMERPPRNNRQSRSYWSTKKMLFRLARNA